MLGLNRKKIFGLDISDKSIEVILLAKSGGKIKVESWGRQLLKGEIVKNGRIKNPELLAKNISEALKEAKPSPIESKYCILSLSESQVFTSTFEFPAGLKKGEIKNTLPYKAEEIIPFYSQEVYFDFKVVYSDKRTQEVFYAATPVEVVNEYLRVLEKLSLIPVAFDLESISLARALIGRAEKDKVFLLMDIGARTTNLNIFDHDSLRLNKVIRLGGSYFTKVISRELNLSEEEAEKIKIKAGFDPGYEKGKILLILQKEFRRLIKETKQIINYYQEKTQSKINQIILAGGSALLPKVDEYLSENLEITAVLGDPLKNIYFPLEIDFKKGAILFANAFGLALRGLKRNPSFCDINLIAFRTKKFEIIPQRQEKEAWRSIYLRGAIFLFLILIFLGLVILKSRGVDFYKLIFPSPPSVIQLESEQDFLKEEIPSPPTEVIKIKKVIIKEVSPYLNIRGGAGFNYPKIGEALEGEKYLLLEEAPGWYKIKIGEDKTGWIVSEYGEVVQE